jgi:dolichol-phosphate mannosyltransferase
VDSIQYTCQEIIRALEESHTPFEILIVNDHSSDGTLTLLRQMQRKNSNIICLENDQPNGFGFAIRKGLDHYSGDCVAIMMGDLSDTPEDLIRFYRAMVEHQVDCVFGSRFIKGGKVINYPILKYLLNRFANNLVRFAFRIKYNDCTNAFKLYKRATIDGLRPLLSPHFNLTLEMPLKAIVRGYTYIVLPNTWTNREHGQSKLKIKEMGSRYFFIFLYCLIEKYFSKGDYRKE